MKHPELYDIRDCKNKTDEACVWHHHDNVNCNFNTGRSEGGQSLNNLGLRDFNPSSPLSLNPSVDEVPYSIEDYRMDYVSWRSIESRTGISKSDVYKFILKELLDNAVDFIESGSHSNNNITPEIKAIIKLNNGTIANSKTISIIVRNSNPNNNPIARGNSKEMLKSIFKIGV